MDLDRIRKLLAIAFDDRTNPNEADAARKAAAQGVKIFVFGVGEAAGASL